MNSFGYWLQDRMNEKGLTQRELARRAHVSQGSVGNVIRGDRKPGEKLCRALAIVLGLPPEEVFRAAGILPPDPGKPPGFEEWVYLYMTASESERQEMLDYARFKKQRRPATG